MQEESAKLCDSLINPAAVPGNYQLLLRINGLATLTCGGKRSRHLLERKNVPSLDCGVSRIKAFVVESYV